MMESNKDEIESSDIPANISVNGSGVDALPKYTFLGEQLRHTLPSETQCQLFCGGAKCKYEGGGWDKGDMIVHGLFSHWATEDILAMARPNTPMIEQHKQIEEFHKHGIKSIFNLQHAWEHAFCGPPLDQESGFSYSPTEFMKHDIYFYNFPWDDYGTVSMTKMLDSVKVLDFALSEGKAAVHCHAGLGRTGTFIACYLIYAKQYAAVDSIMLVRKNRPRSIQTRAQLDCIREFEEFLRPLRVVFGEIPSVESKLTHPYSTTALTGRSTEDDPLVKSSFDGIAGLRTSSSFSSLKGLGGTNSYGTSETLRTVVHREFTLSSYLRHQNSILSGEEARRYKYIPKIINVVCVTMLNLAGFETDLLYVVEKVRPAVLNRRAFTTSRSVNLTNGIQRLSLSESFSSDFPRANYQPTTISTKNWENDDDLSLTHIAAYLLVSELDADEMRIVDEYKLKLNQGNAAYAELEKESNPVVLASLFWSWIDHLKEPVLTSQDLNLILSNKPTTGLLQLDNGTRSLLYYLLHFVSKLFPLPDEIECNLVLRLLSSLTQVNLFSPFDDLQDTGNMLSNDTTLASAMYMSCPAHFSERRSKKEVAQIFTAFHEIITRNFPCTTSTSARPAAIVEDSVQSERKST